MFIFMNITKALSDENRIRILTALSHHEELCVCRLTEMLALSASTVSRHLSLLKNARLIIGRKEGRWMYYRLNTKEDAPAVVINALDWVISSLRNDPVILSDMEKRLNSFNEHFCI